MQISLPFRDGGERARAEATHVINECARARPRYRSFSGGCECGGDNLFRFDAVQNISQHPAMPAAFLSLSVTRASVDGDALRRCCRPLCWMAGTFFGCGWGRGGRRWRWQRCICGWCRVCWELAHARRRSADRVIVFCVVWSDDTAMTWLELFEICYLETQFSYSIILSIICRTSSYILRYKIMLFRSGCIHIITIIYIWYRTRGNIYDNLTVCWYIESFIQNIKSSINRLQKTCKFTYLHRNLLIFFRIHIRDSACYNGWPRDDNLPSPQFCCTNNNDVRLAPLLHPRFPTFVKWPQCLHTNELALIGRQISNRPNRQRRDVAFVCCVCILWEQRFNTVHVRLCEQG